MAALNTSQEIAVNSPASKLLCLAGAGTGKTFCMIQRIRRLVESGVAPSQILALTFTNAAAFEMKERFEKLKLGTQCPRFQTFHSFCYSLIAADSQVRNKLGYLTVPAIATDVDIKRVETSAKLQTNFSVSQKKQSHPELLSQKEKWQIDIYEKAKKRMLLQQHLITFDTLISQVSQLFIDGDDCIQPYIQQFKYIFVDEFQDTDPLQWRFVSAFSDADIFIVGDAQQAIYKFRGADSSIIKSLASDPSWLKVKLSQNYRSGRAVCELANRFTRTYVPESYRVEICSNSAESDVKISTVPDYHTAHKMPAKLYENLLKFVTSSGSNAVLCRTNAEVSAICNFLQDRGIAVTKTRTTHSEVQHLLDAMQAESYAVDWMSSLLPAEYYAQYLRFKTIKDAAKEPVSLYLFVVMFGHLPVISEADLMLRRLTELYASHPCSEKELEQLAQSIAHADISQLPSATTPELLSSSTYVGTIHSVKGLEFDKVALVGVNGPSFKLNSEENKNLLYVGITRAKRHLEIYRMEGAEDDLI